MTIKPSPDLSIRTLQGLYTSSKVTPAQIVESIYDRIEAKPLDPTWISLVPREKALARAHELEGSPHLPLRGVPFAVKDNIDVAGLPTTAGCPAFSYNPDSDAFVVARLQALGAILIGKTNMDQFATGLVGTRSPFGACSSVFDERYISGGSSSGSSVAVASGLVSFALGTDTAGSGRIPAAFNNLVGLKPSLGSISASGVVPACRSLDCISIFALNTGDARAIFDAAASFDAADPFSRESPAPSNQVDGDVRIGVPHSSQLEFFGDIEYQRLYREILADLARSGHTLIEIDFAPFRAAAELLYAGPYDAERFAAVGEFVTQHRNQVDQVVGSIIAGAAVWSASDAYQALYKLRALKRETESCWQKIDLLLLPTAPTTYTIQQIASDPVVLNSRLGYYTNFANLLDLCAVAVPAGFTTAGLPFGVTIFRPAFSEHALLSFAERIQERSQGWISLGVVGAHLSGQPLNHQLTDRGARLLKTTRTATDYRMFALTNTKPAKPGLIREPGFAGAGVETEIWSIHESEFGSFVAAIPPPLSIGTCELRDGSRVKGFLCEPYAISGMPEITDLGSWRAYLQR